MVTHLFSLQVLLHFAQQQAHTYTLANHNQLFHQLLPERAHHEYYVVLQDALFEYSDEIDENEKKLYEESKYRKRYWVMSQMQIMLGEMPNKFILELWEHYAELTKKRDASWDELKKLSVE